MVQVLGLTYSRLFLTKTLSILVVRNMINVMEYVLGLTSKEVSKSATKTSEPATKKNAKKEPTTKMIPLSNGQYR